MEPNRNQEKDKLITFLQMLVLLAGSAVLVGGIFQNSIWFDESYTIGLMSHSLIDVIKISAYDVHPALYYILLKLFTLIFGRALSVMRLFSVIGAVLFAALGFTHVRRDLGKQTGFWFTFVSLTFASTLVYALQIRMYTWAAYFVALSAIYAYRRAKGEDNKKNRILFVVFSIAAAYTHYFALFTIAAINIMLLVKEIRDKKPLKTWFIIGGIQIASYIPGVLVFLLQISLNGASWISIEWPDLVFDLASYHLLGDVLKTFQDQSSQMYLFLGGLFTLLYVGMFIQIQMGNKKDPQRSDAVCWSRIAYFSVIIFALSVSLFRVIYYIRYTFVLNFFLILMIACMIARYRHIWKKIIAVILLCGIFAYRAYGVYDLMYDPSADAVTEYLDSRIEEGDIFLFSGANSYCVTVNYTEYPVYFYNEAGWSVENTYRAFGTNAYVINDMDCDEINSYSGRIWVIDRGTCYDYLMSLGTCQEISSEQVSMRYHSGSFELILIEKE